MNSLIRKSFIVLTTLLTLSSFAANRYWVGGTGNWNDASHWSEASGGQGGAGIPTIQDDVFFDGSSFTIANQTVIISGLAYGKNILWQNIQNAPKFYLDPSAVLYYAQKIALDNHIQYENKGRIKRAKSTSITEVVKQAQSSLKPLNGLSFTVTVTQQNLCAGQCNGQANVTITGGVGPIFTYSWGTTPIQTTANATGLCEGLFVPITVTDMSDGEDLTDFASMTALQPIVTNAFTKTPPTCFGLCDGKLKANFTGGTGARTFLWDNGQTAQTASGLCAGTTYTVTVKDANNCTLSATSSLTEPAVLNPVGSKVDVTCNAACNGSASVVPTGGTSPYTYNWLPGATVASSISGKCPNTYTCTVTDDNGCTATYTANITQPASALDANVTKTNVTCNGANDGTATSTPVGSGTAPYTYLWSNGKTTQGISNLAPGGYTCTVTDANNCTNSGAVTITQPGIIVLDNSVFTPVSCNGGSNGTATVSVSSGGVTPFSYSWSTVAAQTTATATGLTGTTGGTTYTVQVTDVNGCTKTTTYSITQPNAITVDTTTHTNAQCNGLATATATATVSGGNGTNSYLWSVNAGGQATQTATGLAAGQYTVTITDIKSCTGSAIFKITEPAAITIPTSKVDVKCKSNSTGTASAAPTGGAGGFTYSWNDPGNQTTSTATGLIAGSYTVQVKDLNNCTKTAVVTITEPTTALGVSITSQTNVACNGASTGSATATVTAASGTSPYTLSWSNNITATGVTSLINSGLASATYTITVTDANLCTATATASITQPTPLTVNASFTPVSCSGGTNGTATAVGAGGNNASYSYLWSVNAGAQATATATGLSTTTYTVQVTDANACTATTTVLLTSPNPIIIATTPTNLLCNGGTNGQAQATLTSGGTAPYGFSWSNGTTAAPAVTLTATGLSAGTYTVTVVDFALCSATATVQLTEPTAISASITGTTPTCASCSGDATVSASGGTGALSYSWDATAGSQTTTTATGLCQQSYTVKVTDANGCTKTTVATVPASVVINLATGATNVSCAGTCDGAATVTASGGALPYALSWSNNVTATGVTTLNNPALCAATYTITVADANGCTSTKSVDVTAPGNLVISSSKTDILCNSATTGVATAVPVGGTTPYSYSWAPNNETTVSLTGQAAGTYTVQVTDANNCSGTTTVQLTEPNAIDVVGAGGSTNASCGSSDGTITLLTSGGVTAYSYLWTNPAGSTTSTLTGLPAGLYTVTVTDGNACTKTAAVPVNNNTATTYSTAQTNIICPGGAGGDATVTITAGNAPYVFSWSGGTTSETLTTTTSTGLAAGTYTCEVTDALSCKLYPTFTITEPNPFVIPGTITSVSCNGAATGSVTGVVVTGGTGAYGYSWNSVPSQSTADLTGVIAGTYTLTVTDAALCTATNSFVITEPAALTLVMDSTSVLCAGGSNGAAGSTVGGGTPTYTYLWSGTETTPTIVNQTAGTYTLTVTDANSCTISKTVQITEPLALALSTSKTDLNCNAVCIGQADVSVSGGTGLYTYLWTNAGQTDQSITGLCAAIYSVTVTDANGCTETATAQVTEPAAISIAINSITNVSCNGLDDGAAQSLASGGVAPFNYTWKNASNTTLSTNQNLDDVIAGTYTLTVTDDNGCTATKTVVITEPNVLTATVTTTGSCGGTGTGTALAIVNGGTTNYSYSWTTMGQTTGTATGLTSGTYTVEVTDANGCTTTATGIVNPAVNVSVTQTSTISCGGGCTGAAIASVVGATAPYTYSWSTTPSSTSANVTGLCAGTYTVLVTDAASCTGSTTTVFNAPSSINLLLTGISDASCNAVCDGSISLTASGGTGALTYSWNNGATDLSLTGLCAGVYTLTATDASLCSTTLSVTINEPSAIAITPINSTAPTCGASDGAIDITPAGGTSPYTFNWNSGAFASEDISNVPAGSYSLTVTETGGCTKSFIIPLNNSNGPTVDTSHTNVTCNAAGDGTATITITAGISPYSFSWSTGATGTTTSSTIINLPVGPVSCSVTDANGCITAVSMNITQPTQLAVAGTPVDISCNGLTDGAISLTPSGGTSPYGFAWSNTATTQNLTGLTAGGYSVTITDAGGCTTTATFTINDPAVLTATASGTNLSCNASSNGTTTVSPNGGTSPYSYSWSDASSQNTITAAGLIANTYTVTVTDNRGCTTTATTSITEPSSIVIGTTPTQPTCGNTNGSLDASTTTGGTAPYTYAWNGGASAGVIVNNLTPGIYTLQVIDANGCTSTQAVTLNASNGPSLTIAKNVPCSGAGAADATVTASGGATPYTYSWSAGAQTTPQATGLNAGTYTVMVTDASLCQSFGTVTIVYPGAPLAATIAGTNVTCNAATDGAASASVTGGVSPFTYTWSGSASAQSTLAVTGLAANTYTLTVTDNNSCSTTAIVVITEPASITASFVSTSPACTQNNGDITITPSLAGATSYTYVWSVNAASQTTAQATGLAAGLYTVDVTSNTGCTKSFTYTLSNSTTPVVTLSKTNVSCNGSTDGTITASASGTLSPYTYSWVSTPTATTAALSNLAAGIYSVQVTDGNGCVAFAQDTIIEPAILAVAITPGNIVCSGTASGTANAVVTGGTSPYIYSWSTSPVQATQTATGLIAGTYTVQVIDNSGCSTTQTTTISQNAVIAANESVVNSTCTKSNGSITINPSGGQLPYTVQWLTGSTSTSTTITGLASGIYVVEIADINGCKDTSTIALSDTTGPALTTTQKDLTCYGTCNGQAKVVAAGATPFSYAWTQGSATTSIASIDSVTNVCANDYFVTVTDANTCKTIKQVTITSPTKILSNPTITDAACTGKCNGAITVAASGGTSGYTYSWTTLSQTSTTVTALCIGTYSVQITDAAGCLVVDSIKVNGLKVLTPGVTSTNISCNAKCDGTATASVAGGTSPYAYQWNDNGLQNGVTATGLCTGTYSVSIIDAVGCNVAVSTAITQPAPIDGSVVVTNPNCEQCDGKIVGSAITGGVAPYKVLWQTGDTTTTLNNVCAGAYSVKITDAAGCTSVQTVAVSNIGGPTGATVISTNVACYNSCNGTASVTPVGGTSPYTYLWLSQTGGGQTASAVTGLCAGNYNIQITDTKGCIYFAQDTITQPTELKTNPTFVLPTCGNSDGSIAVTASGGTGGYSYSWISTPTATTSSLTGLAAGAYTVVITDASSCADTLLLGLNNVNAPTAAITGSDLACAGVCNGKLKVAATGGSGSYSYFWIGGATTDSLTSLCAGTYGVQVTDLTTGCKVLSSKEITQPAPILANINSAINPLCFDSCNGRISAIPAGGEIAYSYSWSNNKTTAILTGLCSGKFVLTLTDANGCVKKDSVTLATPSALTATKTVVNASCSTTNDGKVNLVVNGGTTGYTYNWSNGSKNDSLLAVKPGKYILTVTDTNGCVLRDTSTIAPNKIITADATTTDSTVCDGDYVNLNGSNSVGSISYQWYLNGNLVGASTAITVLPPLGASNYVLVATDGICSDTDTIPVTNNPLPFVSSGSPVSIITYASTTIGGNPTGPIGASYHWLPMDGLSDTTAANPIASPLQTTTYTVMVVDANGCWVTDSVKITVVPKIVVDEGFTPNGDGINDYWNIGFIDLFPNASVEIYNRWGELLFSSPGYKEKWYGTYNGADLPVGTYYYAITLNDPRYPEKYTGSITIVR